jgi:hypothetical protein
VQGAGWAGGKAGANGHAHDLAWAFTNCRGLPA